MKPPEPKDALLNYEAAIQRVEALEDPQRKQFVMRLVTIATLRVTRGSVPSSPFDMNFFVDCASSFYEQKENLRRLLDGQDLSWWESGK